DRALARRADRPRGTKPARRHVARRDQRRAARRRDARAAHHLHGHRADAAARHRREAAGVCARDADPRHRSAGRDLDPGGLRAAAAALHQQGSGAGPRVPGAGPPADGRAGDKRSVPARRRRGHLSGADAGDRPVEGGRRAECRYGREDARRAVMEVSDVLRDRMQQPSGLNRMLTTSFAVHAVLAAAIVFAPNGLLRRSRNAATVMTITLGGSGTGPDVGGMNRVGGRAIQEVTPPDAAREAPAPPAAKAPEMTMPVPNAKPARAASPTVKQAPDDARGKTASKGAQPAFGSTSADTGVRGQGFGLTTGGGAGSGSALEITGDFCCPEYLGTLITRIRAAWNQNQGARGTSLIRFTIRRDGSITDATIFKSSGVVTLDNAALRAVLATRTLPPLPDAYSNPTLTMRLNFEYQ